MTTVRTIQELESLYDAPMESAVRKEVDHLTPLHAAYIEASPFVLLATGGPDGLDCFPRGEPAGCVAVRDALPTCVIEVRTQAVYAQCPKALVRSGLWDATRHRDPAELPTVDEIVQAVTRGELDATAYDRAYPERLRTTLYRLVGWSV